MVEQPDRKNNTVQAAKELFDFACRELTEAKKAGREQDRRRFFELARAIEGAFPHVSFLPSPIEVKDDNPDGGTDSIH